jgi:hypothetical protein
VGHRDPRRICVLLQQLGRYGFDNRGGPDCGNGTGEAETRLAQQLGVLRLRALPAVGGDEHFQIEQLRQVLAIVGTTASTINTLASGFTAVRPLRRNLQRLLVIPDVDCA